MKLLNITKEIDELSLFEKLFLLNRIWQDLAEAMDGLLTTAVTNESIMAEVNSYCDDEDDRSGLFDVQWTEENLPDNVVVLRDRNL